MTNATPAGVNRRPGRSKDTLTRDQFLDAAVQLFGEQGLAATTMAQIAKSMGFTGAMVHYHFANREQLLDAVVFERILPVVNELWAPVTSDALADPRAVILRLARDLLTCTRNHPWLPSLWLNDIASVSGELRERLFAHMPVDRFEALTQAIADAQQKGEINPELLPHHIFNSIAGLILFPLASSGYCSRLHSEQVNFSIEALDRHVEALLVAAIKP